MPRPHLDHIAVRFRRTLTPSQRRAIADRCHLLPFSSRHHVPGEDFALLAVAPTADPRRTRHARSVAALSKHPDVAGIALVHRHNGVRYFATDRVWLETAGGINSARVRKVLGRGARILETVEGREFLVQLPPGADPAATCVRLAKLPSVRYAEPDFVVLGRKHSSQSALEARSATGQFCVRVTRTTAVWKLFRGNAGITVAILDDGVMAEHPDLRSCLTANADATGGRGAPHPKPWDSHGTGCAGLAVGTNRVRRGVKGVAAGSSLMAVRVGYTPTRDGDYLCKTAWIRRGIDWAWQHGADVISMSFGGGPRSAPVVKALERARRRGRGGKGCVLVAAAGNAADPGEPVEFPGSLPFVLAVGATNRKDQPQTKIDRTSIWVSNSGPEVNIGAPGVNNYTCTIPDPDEGETDLNDPGFSGTSAATPLVAGAAALVLSVDPDLTEAEVRALLCDTADKIGPAPYHGGRNDQVGTGRLNVLAAVRSARRPH